MGPLGIMPDKKIRAASFRKRYLLKLLAMPSSLFPLLFGLTDLMVLWALNISSGAGVFAGLAGILLGAGIFLNRLVLGDKKISASVLESLQEDEIKRREKALDDLDLRLCNDEDPRDENLLRDLRSLAALFEKGSAWTGTLKDSTTFDILSGVDRMFQECVVHLEKSLELKEKAETMTTNALKKPLLTQREAMLKDINQSIGYLGKILADITALDKGLDESRDSDLTRIRDELDQSLSVARKVNERMGALSDELSKEI